MKKIILLFLIIYAGEAQSDRITIRGLMRSSERMCFAFRGWSSYQFLLMSDYNQYRKAENDYLESQHKPVLPSFHNGMRVGGEFICFFRDKLGIGVESGLIFTEGVDYERSEIGITPSFKDSTHYQYKHSAGAIPILFSAYYLSPQIPYFTIPARAILGLGGGLYFISADFYMRKDYRINWYTGWWEESREWMKASFSSLKPEFHITFALETPITYSVSLFIGGKIIGGNFRQLRGDAQKYYSEKDPNTETVEDTTQAAKLGYNEAAPYFGPVFMEEWNPNIRDGAVDFRGFELGFGILYRF